MAKGPKQEKPKPIEIVSVARTRKTICIHWKQGDGKFDLDERDNPLPSFVKAMDALAPIAGTICHFTKGYSETGLRVVGMELGEQSGAGTVALKCRKDIDDAAKEFAFKTPERLLAHPSEPGKYTPPLDKEQAGLVEEAVEQAKLYVRGERAQGQIEFEDDDEDDTGDGEEAAGQGQLITLPTAEESAAPAPTKKPRKSKK